MVRITQLAFKNAPAKANVVLLHCFTFTSLNIAIDQKFNDAFLGMFCLLAVLQFQYGHNLLGVILLSLGLGTKMGAALYIPAIYLITSKSQGLVTGTLYVVLVAFLQLAFAYPFIITYPHEYFNSAFDIGRDFLIKRSYNWNIIPQVVVENFAFKNGLLLVHIAFLLYMLFTKWLDKNQIFKELGVYPFRICSSFLHLDAYHVAEVFFLCNFVGIVCARGFHFQFHFWYVFSLPFLFRIGVMKLHRFKTKTLIGIFCSFDLMHWMRATYIANSVISQIIMLVIFYYNIKALNVEEKEYEQGKLVA